MAKQTQSKLKKNTFAETRTLEEMLFFGFFVLLSVTKGLGLYEGQKLFELLVLPAFVMGFLKILVTPYTKKQWIMQSILLILTGVVFVMSHERGILFLMFLVLGMKHISVKKVFRVGMAVWTACAIFSCCYNFFRIEHTVYRVHSKMGLGHIFRWSLGFTHPNILHITYLLLCAFLLYELGMNYKFKHFFLLMAGNLIIFLYSVSYTGFGIVSVLLMGGYYGALRKKFCLFEKFLANLVLPGCLTLSFICPAIMFGTPFAGPVQRLNFLLNTRIYLAYCFLNDTYMSLFGKDISKVVQSSMTLDNSYIWGFINYGLIPFSVLMIGYLVLMAYTSYKNRTMELVLLVCFLGAGFTEPFLFNTSFKNITLVLLGEMLFAQKEAEAEYALIPRLQRPEEGVRNKEYVKTKQGILRQEYLIPYIGLPECLWNRMKAIGRQYKKQICIGAVIGMMAGLLLCFGLYRSPQGYLVPRSYTDGMYETSVFVDGPDSAQYSEYKIMNYKDEQTPMQVVDGKAITLERVRYLTGSTILGGFAAGVIVFGFCWYRTGKKNWQE